MAFTRILKLKQHTPLLHFQYDQQGATLRATELKPKLDKFILDKEGDGVLKDFAADPSDDEKGALDYKLRISAEKVEEYVVASSMPKHIREELDRINQKYLSDAPYFADNPYLKKGNWEESRRAVMYKNIQVEVFSFHERLVELVEKHLPYLLTYENFGTRQSKGFGSFSLEGTTVKEYEEMILQEPKFRNTYHYKSPKSDLAFIFKTINDEYKALKSGSAKERSQLMEYFKTKKIDWEKPAIKDNLVKRRMGSEIKKDLSKDNRQKYIRAFLGLAELYEFPQSGAKINISCFDGENLAIEPIDRFKSPITFKVFENNIYMLTHEIPPELFDRTFKFSNGAGEVLINTPPKSANFDLDEFLEKHHENSWNYVK